MRLPFRLFPKHLQVVSVLLLVWGIVNTGWIVVDWIRDGVRPPGLPGALLTSIGAGQLMSGKREGLAWLLVPAVLAVASLVYGIAAGANIGPGVIAALACAVGLASYLAWCWFRVAWKEPGSFEDWVTNPELRDAADDWFEHRDAMLARDAEDPPDPDELVAGLLGRDPDLAEHRIRAQLESAQRARVEDAIIRALGTKRFRKNTDLVKTLVEFLPRERIAQERELVAELVARTTDHAREALLGLLAANGDENFAAEYAEELRRDENPWQIAKGLAKAAVGGRASERLAAAVVPGLRARVGAAVGSDYATIALAHLDPAYVDDLLARAARLEPGTEDQLRTLARFGCELPQDRWDAVVRASLEAGEWSFAAAMLPHATLAEDELAHWIEVAPEHFESDAERQRYCGASRACGAALLRMAELYGADAEPYLRRGVEFQREAVAVPAARGIARLAGVPEYYLHRLDVDAPHPVNLLYALYAMDWRVKNGGFVMALTSPEDRAVGLLPTALETIAPPQVREIVEEAVQLLFDDDPLPSDREPREARMAERHGEVWDPLQALDRRYFDVDYLLEVHMHLYAAEHGAAVVAALHPSDDSPGEYSNIR